jgi:hypothetical protein
MSNRSSGLENLKENKQLEEIGVDGMIILHRILISGA